MTIKELYLRLPKVAERGIHLPPSKKVVRDYLDSVGAAYTQAQLEPAPGVKRQERPGFVDTGQQYMFQVGMIRNAVGYERAEFIAESLGRELVLHGLVGVFDGRHNRSAAALASSMHEPPHEFQLTPDAVSLVTGFIIEKCAAGLFVPVQPSVPRTVPLVEQL